jgi:hypothetical protein
MLTICRNGSDESTHVSAKTPSRALNLGSHYTKAAPVASVNDTHSMRRTISTRTILLHVGQGGNQAVTHLVQLLVLLSPLAVDRSDLERRACMARHYIVDKSRITRRLRLAITYGPMFQRSHNQAMVDQPAPPTGAPRTAVHQSEP